MEDLLDKISQYQLFNFLLSGAILVVILSRTTPINLIDGDDAIAIFFTYYFVGLVISRVGSLIIEPLLKQLNVIKFAPYAEYLSAVKKDPKIDTLSQENNTYRTLASTSLIYLVIYMISKHASSVVSGKSTLIITVLSCFLLILFIFAYRKQTSYITKRIEKSKAK